VHLYFLSQPWPGGRNLNDFLEDAINEGANGTLRIAVAWAKRSGIARIQPHLKRLTDAGGRVELIVGISEGGATRQGLELALVVASSVHIFHDVAGSTFHPKVYQYDDGEKVHLLVGSQNLTAGGLFHNYEAGIELQVAGARSGENTILKQVDDWFGELAADSSTFIRLSPQVLALLVADPAYKIGDEDRPYGGSGAPATGPARLDDSLGAQVVSPLLFTASARKKRHMPIPSRREPAAVRGLGAARSDGDTVALNPLPSALSPVTRLMWSKKLSASDAQHPPHSESKRTGALRLGKSVHEIDKNTFFRDDMFGNLTWAQDGNKPHLSFCIVPFRVTISDQDLGTVGLRVDHDVRRIAGQNNVPTVLKWGALNQALIAVNHESEWVALEALLDGTFSLTIGNTQP
jgi:HKD family nuclease